MSARVCVCVCVFDTRDEDDETPLGQVNLLDWIHFEIGPDQRVCARTLHLRLLTGHLSAHIAFI